MVSVLSCQHLGGGKQRGSWVTGYFIKAVPPLVDCLSTPRALPFPQAGGTGELVGCVARWAEEAELRVPGVGMTGMCDIRV